MDADLFGTPLDAQLRGVRGRIRQAQQYLSSSIFSLGSQAAIEYSRLTFSQAVFSIPAERLGRSIIDLAGETTSGRSSLKNHLAIPLRSPDVVPQVNAQVIRQRMDKAEQMIRQQLPAQALRLLQTPGTPAQDWPVFWQPHWYALMGWALLQHNQPQKAKGFLEQGLQLIESLLQQPQPSDERLLQEVGEWLRYFLGESYGRDDQPVQALLCFRQGLAASVNGAICDPELMTRIYQGLGNIYLTLGRSAKAITFFDLSRKYGQDVYDPCTQGFTEWGLGLAYQHQGNLAQAQHTLLQALRIFEQLDTPILLAQLQSTLGLVLARLQHLDEAEVLLRQSLGIAGRLGDTRSRGAALANMAALHLARHMPDKAIRTVQNGLSVLQQTWDHQIAGQLYLTLAWAYELQHNLSATEDAFKTAIGLLRQTQQVGLMVEVYERYGQFLAGQGRFQEACTQLQLASVLAGQSRSL